MKSSVYLLVLTLAVSSCENGTENSGVTPVSYKLYKGYSYRGAGASGDSTFFHHTTGTAAFNALFYYIMDEGRHDTIPKADIASQRAVSVVKWGNEWYEMDVALAYLRGDTLELAYTATVVSANMTFTVAEPMIVMIDASFRNVKFIENGTLVKRM